MQKIQRHLSQKKKQTFSQIFSSFLKSTLNFQNFQKKVTPIAYIFLNLRTPKDVVR